MLMEYRYHSHPYTLIRPYSHCQPLKLILRALFFIPVFLETLEHSA